MAPALNPLLHLADSKACLNFQPVLRPPGNIKTIRTLRYHSLELLRFECGKQIQPSINDVIRKANASGLTSREDSFEPSFPLTQWEFRKALAVQEQKIKSKVNDEAVTPMVLKSLKALYAILIDRDDLAVDNR